MTIFADNLALWARVFPQEAARLSDLVCKHVFIREEKEGVNNLILEKDVERYDLYATHDPLEETRQWFASLNLDHVNVLYVYGVGLGYAYEAAKAWLKASPQHYLVFLEDNPEVLHRLFETPQATELLKDKQVRLYDISLVDKFDERIRYLARIFGRYEILVVGLDFYLKEFADRFHVIQSNLAFWHHYQASLGAEFLHSGEHFYRNFYQNLRQLPQAFCGSELYGKFKGVPAIICGAGPSLEKNLGLLETLGDRALIFAGGSAMNAVNSHGFRPTFGAGIDPNPEQLTRLIMNTAYEVPFLYRSRMYYKALDLVHGTLLYVTGSGGYKISKWLEESFKILGEHVDEGFNVINFNLSIAQAMGCNPIILVGVDLAYTDRRSYHSGVISHPLHSRHHDFRTKGLEDLLVSPDIFGEPVYTLWKWITESYWISRFTTIHPNVLLINSTEGGIGMQGIPNKPLDEVIHHLLQRRFDFSVWTHGEIQETSLSERVTQEGLADWLKEVFDSSTRCFICCEELKKETLRLVDLQKGEGNIIEESEVYTQQRELLESEPSFKYILKDLEVYFNDNTCLENELLDRDSSISEVEKKRQRLLLRAKGYDYLLQSLNANNRLVLIELAKAKTPSVPVTQAPPFHIPEEKGILYSFEDNALVIQDPELGISISEPAASNAFAERMNYPSGKIKLEHWYANQVFHGPTSFFSEEGQLLARSWYVHGIRQGKVKKFYLSGNPFSIQQFRDGLRHGVQRYFYSNGVLRSLINYQLGKLEGTVSLYYATGQLKRELHFVQGKRQGIERIWNEAGVMIVEAEYNQDRPQGVAKRWHDNGVIAQEEHFDAAGKTTSVVYWDENGMSVPVTNFRKDDFFDAVAKEMETLTHAFEKVCTGLGNLLPMLAQGERWVQELEELKQKIGQLESLNKDLYAESGLSENSLQEPVWKTVARQRELQSRVQAMTQQLSQDIRGIEDALKFLAKSREPGQRS